MPRVCQILRVFTRDGEGGNHLGVVNDVIGLTDAGMQAIAADLGFSETVFVDWIDAVPAVRIFTPVAEIPFAGHPLVGTAYTLLHLGPGGVDTVRCATGDIAIGMDDDMTWIEAPLDASRATPADLSPLCEKAGIPDPVRGWMVDVGSDYAVVELADEHAVGSLTPDADGLAGPHGVLVYARDGSRVRSRFFAPHFGVFEDPATGSAAVAMATALLLAGESQGDVVIHQGEEMGHPSRIDLSWTSEKARLGGGCVRDEVRFLND